MMLDPVGCRVPGDWFADPSLCWFEWQTFITGGLALAAALWAGRLLSKQIRQTEKLHQRELMARHNAARVALPLALSGINDFIEGIAREVAAEIERFQPDGIHRKLDAVLADQPEKKRFDRASVGADVISAIQRFIETLADEREVRHVAELIASIQVLQSRFNSFDPSQAAPVLGLYDLLFYTAKIKFLNDSMYNYARFTDEGTFSVVGTISNAGAWKKIHQKAESLIFERPIPDVFFARLKELTDHCIEQDLSPWNEKFGE